MWKIPPTQGITPHLVSDDNLVITRIYQSLQEMSEGIGKNLASGLETPGPSSTIPATLLLSWGLEHLFLGIIAVLNTSVITTFDLGVIIGGYLSFVFRLFVVEFKVNTKGTSYVIF